MATDGGGISQHNDSNTEHKEVKLLLYHSLVAIGLPWTTAIVSASLVSPPLLRRVERHTHGIVFVLLHYFLGSKAVDLSEHNVIKNVVSRARNMEICCWKSKKAK